MIDIARRQNVLVVVGAIAVIVVSSMLTLYAVRLVKRNGAGQGEQAAYQNVTFTDAVLSCETEVRDNYGKRIRNLVVDNHSSRYDGKQFTYKIFLQLDLYKIGGAGVSENYINCFVRSSNGVISKFDVMEVEETEDGVRVNDDTNVFGIPIRKDK